MTLGAEILANERQSNNAWHSVAYDGVTYRIGSIEQFAFDELIQRFLQRVDFDCDVQRHEFLFALVTMRTPVGADHLIAEDPFELLVEDFVALRTLQVFIDLIGQSGEEIEGILLFTHVDLLAPQSEHVPEGLRRIVLHFAFQQMSERLLELVEQIGIIRSRRAACAFTIVLDTQNVLRYLREHEQLLKDRVHVTRGTT